MSPIHLKYLGNMGVRSSMSISIVINSELWGLIACHEYGDLGLRVSLPIRELCRNIGGCAATNVERLLMLQRIEARKPPTLDPPTQSPAGFIAASSADLLRSFDASFGLLSIQDEARAIGRLDPYREALVVLRYLQSRRLTTIVSSQNIGEDFPDINYEPGIHAIAGLLLIPLSIGGHDFLVFFRKGQLREVQWAGNPYEKIVRPGSQYLEPRTSFTRWIETVVGRSTEWIEDQLATATILSHLYGKFIEIWRQMESASQKSRMTRLLIRNSSHEVRTPLNAIVNYLEMALENKLEDSTRDLLEKAHKESRSLIYVIDDLLNLTKAEDGPINRLGDTFDLGATVSDVITAFRKEAMRKGLDLTVSTHLGIPEMVRGDPSRLRQVLSNVTSNAFQHSNQGGIKVDMRPIRTHDTTSIVSISVQDAGVGMSESQLDDLFQEFEQVVDEDSRTLSTDNTPSGNDNSRSLGVGLAVVARYIRNTHGQIRVNSEPGKGTIFVLEIPFEHASPASIRRLSSFPADHLSLPRTLSDTSSPSISLPHHKGKALLEKGQGKTLGHSSGSPPENEHHANRNPGFPSSGFPSAGLSSHSLESGGSKFPFPDMDSDPASTPRGLSVLIAEDNPINVRLLTRRLLKLGHEVEIAYDGQECHDHFTSKPHKIDVILMDIQMPLVDGAEATKMIRKFEKDLQDLLLARPRVPIIAVSASLTEDNRFEYVQNGFDGWILKPIDFGRLDFLLQGIRDRQLRCEALYVPKRGETAAPSLVTMKATLFELVAAATWIFQSVEAQCPDYSQYSQQQHSPLSTGRYQLSYMRPDPACRTFNSSIVEDTINSMQSVITDPDLYRLFQNSYPNTLDTAVKWKGFSANNSKEELTFLITGDINAMWLRDSANQMQSYLPLVTANTSYNSLASLYRGVINLQARYIIEAPHCNSFQPPSESGIGPSQNQATPDDFTPPIPTTIAFECKYELDSLAAFLEISTDYYEATGDIDFFRNFQWVDAVNTILSTTEALLLGTYADNGSVNALPYTWQRTTTSATETLDNSGRGNPVQGGTGLVRSAFRPSDDSFVFPFPFPTPIPLPFLKNEN
ncbi:hypothetical protein G7Y89_g14916 [Cudoniella acicularis]|uniref:Phytochrome n=1 Tax=Cudoniella acicularis TaxID=354080 RepID=A0A8H4VQA0_9HELO|nr:hypothetical protein G7Y89_g14916 [Cudoniella acicularis]